MNPLRLLETAEMGGLFVLVLVLAFVGNKVSQGYDRTRGFCVGLSGLLLIAYVVFQFQRSSHLDLVEVALRGLLGTGIVLGALWTVMPPLAAAYLAVSGTVSRWKWKICSTYDRMKASLRDGKERRRREKEQAAAAPEREKARLKAEETARQYAAAQKRREDARARCEVLFATHSFEIRERFTREMFDAFMSRHFGEDKPPEYVEKLAVELCGIIQKHLEKTSGGAQKTLAELAEWFLKEKKQIESTALSDRDKQDMLSQLEERYVKLQGKYLRSMQP